MSTPNEVVSLDAVRARAAGRDYFVRPVGNPVRRTLGTGKAVFMGGVDLITATGARVPLVGPPGAWIWPAILLACAVLAAPAMVWASWPDWQVGALLGSVFGLILIGAAIAAYVGTRRARSVRLVVDARDRTFREQQANQTILVVPASWMKQTRVQEYTDRDLVVVYNVLVHVGVAELLVHQDFDAAGAGRIAHQVAEAMGIPYDTTVERFS